MIAAALPLNAPLGLPPFEPVAFIITLVAAAIALVFATVLANNGK